MSYMDHQSLHLSGLFMAASAGQENSFWKSSELPSGPMTLNLPGECTSVSTWLSRDSGVWISHHTCSNIRLNSEVLREDTRDFSGLFENPLFGDLSEKCYFAHLTDMK